MGKVNWNKGFIRLCILASVAGFVFYAIPVYKEYVDATEKIQLRKQLLTVEPDPLLGRRLTLEEFGIVPKEGISLLIAIIGESVLKILIVVSLPWVIYGVSKWIIKGFSK